jgi:cytochrome P450
VNTTHGFDEMAQFTGTIAGDVRDPYPDLLARRQTCPAEVVRQSGIEGTPTEVLHVYGYEDVEKVLRDDRTFASEIIRRHIGPVMGSSVLVGLDGEEHRKHRALISKPFRQGSIARWDDEIVKPTVHSLIDQFEHLGAAELVRQYTYLFPVHVIGRILGIPSNDDEFFRDRGLAVVSMSADPSRGIKASLELRSYFSRIIELKRAAPGDDLISQLLEAELDGERLTEDEIHSFLLFLLPAGVETTYRATGSLLFALLTHPAQLDEVRADRLLVGKAVEESLRWEPPMLHLPRITTRSVDVAGIEVPPGVEVSYCIATANRDEDRWEDPNGFDIHRRSRAHLSFGLGVHLCLGMHLARMEMAAATNALLDRLRGLRLDPASPHADPHIHGSRFRSPTSIPVLFEPA